VTLHIHPTLSRRKALPYVLVIRQTRPKSMAYTFIRLKQRLQYSICIFPGSRVNELSFSPRHLPEGQRWGKGAKTFVAVKKRAWKVGIHMGCITGHEDDTGNKHLGDNTHF